MRFNRFVLIWRARIILIENNLFFPDIAITSFLAQMSYWEVIMAVVWAICLGWVAQFAARIVILGFQILLNLLKAMCCMSDGPRSIPRHFEEGCCSPSQHCSCSLTNRLWELRCPCFMLREDDQRRTTFRCCGSCGYAENWNDYDCWCCRVSAIEAMNGVKEKKQELKEDQETIVMPQKPPHSSSVSTPSPSAPPPLSVHSAPPPY